MLNVITQLYSLIYSEYFDIWASREFLVYLSGKLGFIILVVSSQSSSDELILNKTN